MCADEKYHEQIRIEADSCGHCYEEIFGRFIGASVTEVHVEDSYIRSTHQARIHCVSDDKSVKDRAFLANRTKVTLIVRCVIHLSVICHLSVTKCTVAKQYVRGAWQWYRWIRH